MSTRVVPISNRLSITDFERFHGSRSMPAQQRPSIRELLLTAVITIVISPFSFVTFMVIPMMGQVTVGFAFLLTCLYLFYRKSVLVCLTALTCFVIFWSGLFLSIQAIKSNLEVALFFFTAMGIPVSAMYCMFIGARIWSIRGGAE